ncbi:hypothetical protein [Methanorbis furvi]|uniref:RCK N-terminal domain-containing protein n=1 Tax=Methanorbis furvi TaxID=3028299 RepID=A0AAE4MDN0_9EURY|nr:hypothetical protein [Methanocorpusculaceae archaeon Ag1]
MFLTTALILSYAILAATLIFLIVFRLFRKKWYRSIPVLGIFLAGVAAYYPLSQEYSVFSTLVHAIVESWQMFLLEINYGDVLSHLAGNSEELITGYEILLAILHLLAPVCTAVIILSVIGDYLAYGKIWIFRFTDRHIFSDLNEKTLSLIRDMKTHKVPGSYIICGLSRSEREENLLYEEAKKCGCIIIDRSVQNVPPAHKKKTSYYLISSDGSINLDLALSLMEKSASHKNRDNIRIYVTSNETEAEYLLDQKTQTLGNNAVYTRHIDEPQLMAYELLYDNPLYLAVTDDWKNVSMLLIGAGYVGLEVLKSSLWCSRTNGQYTFSATVADKNAERTHSLFVRDCPALEPNDYNLTFLKDDIDAETADLINLLEKNKGNYNYIVIATNDDEINIRAALDIQAWYYKQNYPAYISVVIRDIQKYKLLTEVQKKSQNTSVKIFPFGCSERMYSHEKIIENKLEQRAVCINETYNLVGNSNPDKPDYTKALASWKELPLLKKRSSTALAVFIKYVLWMRGYEISTTEENETYQITDHELEEYSQLEHQRWNAYTLTEGYYPFEYDKLISHKNNLAHINGDLTKKLYVKDENKRLHGCITDWDTICKIAKDVNGNYAEYDRNFIRRIPQIISGYNGTFGYKYYIRKK